MVVLRNKVISIPANGGECVGGGKSLLFRVNRFGVGWIF